MNPIYFVFLGIAVLVFVGLLVYVRFFAKRQEVGAQAVSEPDTFTDNSDKFNNADCDFAAFAFWRSESV